MRESLVRDADRDRYLAALFAPADARRAVRAVCLQRRDRARARAGARADARRNPAAMVARGAVGASARAGGGASGRRRAARHDDAHGAAAAVAPRPDRCARASISTTIRSRPWPIWKTMRADSSARVCARDADSREAGGTGGIEAGVASDRVCHRRVALPHTARRQLFRAGATCSRHGVARRTSSPGAERRACGVGRVAGLPRALGG